MRVLIGCEYSGRIRRAMQALGHDVTSCDMLASEDASPDHYVGDVRDLLGGGRFDIGIFHPPCTYLTCAAEWAYGPGPYHQKVKPGTLTGEARQQARREAVDFVLTLWRAPIPRIAIENPVGILAAHIGKPAQIIQPYQFGEDASKGTCLWLKGLPPLRPTGFIEPRWVCCGIPLTEEAGRYGCANCHGEKRPRPRWGNQTDSGQNRLPRQTTDGKIEAGLIKASRTPSRTNGPESLCQAAYRLGFDAGQRRDLQSNPQFSSYGERIHYRAGWLAGMKKCADQG